MPKTLPFVFVVIGQLLSAECQSSPWLLRNAIPTGRLDVGAAIAWDLPNPFVVAVGGDSRVSPGTYSSRTERYLCTADTWTTVRSMPTARQRAGAHYSSGGVVYVIGGDIGPSSTYQNERYAVSTQTWTSGTAMPSGARDRPGYGKLGDVFMCVGGNAPISAPSLAFDVMTDSWTSKKAIPTGRLGLAVATDGSAQLYAIAGVANPNAASISKVEKYNMATDAWATVARTPWTYIGMTAVHHGANIYTIGGATYMGSSSDLVSMYAVATDVWSQPAQVGPLNLARLGGVAVAGLNALFLIGGENDAVDGLAVTAVPTAAPTTTRYGWAEWFGVRVRYFCLKCGA